jgi:hypothetical protein
MSANDSHRSILVADIRGSEMRDDRVLAPGMGELLDRDARVLGGDLDVSEVLEWVMQVQ